ncbi:MAG: hypothetical protein ACNS62_10915, partial [Candidatus Cyclobacteriaceae bacterium M3_2C_046]
TEGSNDLYKLDIHHNIIIDAKMEGVGVTEATYKANPAKVQKIKVYNNTIVGSGGHVSAIGWQGYGINIRGFEDNPDFKDVEVKHNIITETTGRPISNVYAGKEAHNINISHNLVYPEGDTTPDWMKNEKSEKFNVLGENVVVDDPAFRNTRRGDYRLTSSSPARNMGQDKQDLGAIAYHKIWQPGKDWAGQVTAYYYPETIWQPLMIPRGKFTMHRNHHQRPSWFQRNRYGVDFQNLPAGEQAFAGVTFFIPDEAQITWPSILALRGRQAEVEAENIENIPVQAKTSKLAFLQAYHLQNKEIEKGEQLFHFRVNYSDGSREIIPVHWQVEIEDWLAGPDELHNLEAAELAWHQAVLKKRGGTQQIRLYKMEWENPKPEVEIVSLDMINNREYQDGAPAVFAISLVK